MEDRFEEIRERTLFVVDSVDKQVEAFLDLEDYEWLIKEIERLQTVEQAYRALKSAL